LGSRWQAARKGYSTFFSTVCNIVPLGPFFQRPPFFSIRFPKGELFVPIISCRLHYGQSQTPVLEIIPDPTGLYCIAWPDIGLSDVAILTRCKQAALEMGAASAHGQGVQFVGGSAFEITQEFFVASLVQRFKSPERTQGRLDSN
jgi:hypothetical protein